MSLDSFSVLKDQMDIDKVDNDICPTMSMKKVNE